MPAYKEKYRQRQIDKKTDEIRAVEEEISKLEVEYEEISSKYELVKNENQSRQDTYDEAEKDYTRVSAPQNVDIVSEEQSSQSRKNYKEAKEELRVSNDKLKKIENEKKSIESELGRLRKKKIEKEIKLLELQAKCYEDELREGVWVEGFGESILDENKTPKECEQLALKYAERDAIERGGKSLIEFITQVEMFELTKDDIRKTAKVNIIDRDNSGDYGEVKQESVKDIVEDIVILKYTVKVRVKVQSVDIYNPYRERIKELRAPERKPPSVEGSEIEKGKEQDEEEKKELDDLKSKIEALEEAMKKDGGEQQSKEKEQELRKREQELKEQEQQQQEEKQQHQTPRYPQYEEKKERDFVPLPMF
ncbi:hypothetical protein KJ693_12185 [bacterium]|nr:hypothetical protein [bacterium]